MNFKKLLSAIGLLAIATPAALSAVACGGGEEPTAPELTEKEKLIKAVSDAYKNNPDGKEFIDAARNYLAFKFQEFANLNDANNPLEVKKKQNGRPQTEILSALRGLLINNVNEDRDRKENKDTFPPISAILYEEGTEGDGDQQGTKVIVNEEESTFKLPDGDFKIGLTGGRAQTSVSGTFHYEYIKKN